MRLKYLAVALVALLFASATSTVASVGEIRLYVDGLACPFCTFGIEKSLKKVPGVVSVETTNVWAEVHGLVVLFRTGRFGQDADSFQETYCTSVNRILKGLMANG